MSYPYGLIGNCVSAALVSSDASIDWLCMPYFDSPSLFAKILDDRKGGFFKITGVNTVKTSQEYVRHTAILKTRIETSEGIFDVYDFMPRFVLDSHHYYCPCEIQRNIRVISGQPRITVQLDARPNYSASRIKVTNEGEYLKIITTEHDYYSYYLYSNLDLESIYGQKEIVLPASSYLVLSYHQKIRPFDADRNYMEFERTKSYWLGWVSRTVNLDSYREMVIRSMITLKLLMYQRTGAVIAAPTTSLPEIVGKERNWDYRYCWIRDASMMIELFSRLGHFNASAKYMNFILDRMLSKNQALGVMYNIHGEKVSDEKVITTLSGYKNSSPVRIGNDAHKQIQNDLYGELVDTIYTYFVIYHKSGFHFDQELWTVVRTLVNNVEKTWKDPDNGIWEYRGEAQHHVFSKLMSWVAMDRAARIAKVIGKKNYADECSAKAELIRNEILERGWNPDCNAFTMYYGSKNADAAVLLMLRYGFLSPDDPRMVNTVDFCMRELYSNDSVMRYTHNDDFGKPENTFIIAGFWMVNALYLIGRKDQVRDLFKSLVATANHVGLFSEGYDTRSKAQVGNFPQGYSHMAFIQSVLLLETDYQWDFSEHYF